MSGLFNRLKSRKTTPNSTNNSNTITSENEPTTPACTFDEEGFLCPMCHQKFNDHTALAQHYTDVHAQEPVIEKENTTKENNKQENVDSDIALWKQQFMASEETRMILSNELIQQKQRSNDLEEELQLIQKHLKSTQTKAAEQSQEIASLKATKDVYESQFAIFTNELLKTQDELKEKEQQITTLRNDLIPRSTTDDVDVLKRELITVQQCMNEMALEKEQQIDKLRNILMENYQSVLKLERVETKFNQSLSIHDELINENTSQIGHEINAIKQFVRVTHKRQENIKNAVKYMRNRLLENQTEMKQLKQTNIQLQIDLQIEQRQINSYRNQIETLNNEIHALEKTSNDLKEEKNQVIQTKIGDDEDNDRQNFIRQIIQEKDQYEQQIKECRIQIKELNNQRQQIQDECDQMSKQILQITNEKNQLQNEQNRVNNEMDLLKKQFDENNKDKEQKINELKHQISTLREQHISTENSLRIAKALNNNQNQEIDTLKTDSINQVKRFEKERNDLKQTINQQEQLQNVIKVQLNTIEKEKYDIEQQVQIKQQIIEELYDKLDHKNNSIKRLSIGIHHSLDIAHKTHAYIEQNIHKNQMNILTMIEQTKQESQSIRAQTLEQIREEFTSYLTIYHTLFIDSKVTKFNEQIEKDNMKLNEQQQQSEKQLNKIKHAHDKLIDEHHEQKQKFEIQLGELNNNLLQVSESLSEATQAVDTQREKYEKQITSLKHDLEFQIKKNEMQLSALKENLATVRTELRAANVKLAELEHIKAEKADTDARLAVSQEERRVLLERSLANESKNEKLIAENAQLIKKNSNSDAALQEMAREFQSQQIQLNKVSQRRWIDDDDINSCMKCHQTFSVTQRKHHCRNCGNIFCDPCSSKTAVVAATSKKPKRVCDQCYKDLTS
ncbi:unnamed protein product [Adineta steineri]|uniref:Early endosome antigen 1 n=1 Tax=Adineta steineri TaxID=433720 RepID=A0A819QB15_9BILA|nr:unnamed protein product [Adineta steineri]